MRLIELILGPRPISDPHAYELKLRRLKENLRRAKNLELSLETEETLREMLRRNPVRLARPLPSTQQQQAEHLREDILSELHSLRDPGEWIR